MWHHMASVGLQPASRMRSILIPSYIREQREVMSVAARGCPSNTHQALQISPELTRLNMGTAFSARTRLKNDISWRVFVTVLTHSCVLINLSGVINSKNDKRKDMRESARVTNTVSSALCHKGLIVPSWCNPASWYH